MLCIYCKEFIPSDCPFSQKAFDDCNASMDRDLNFWTIEERRKFWAEHTPGCPQYGLAKAPTPEGMLKQKENYRISYGKSCINCHAFAVCSTWEVGYKK